MAVQVKNTKLYKASISQAKVLFDRNTVDFGN
jgi:hypothetical protein